MSSRLLRIDAMVFRGGSVRFEACPAFRGADTELCECGWLEADHGDVTVVSGRRFPRRRVQPAAARQAS
jgi:hypothetical protein